MLKKSEWHEPFYIWNYTVTLDSQRKTNEHKSSGKCHQLAAELVWNPDTLREAFGNVNRMRLPSVLPEYITNQLKYNSSYCMCLHPQKLRHYSLRYIESVEDSIIFLFCWVAAIQKILIVRNCLKRPSSSHRKLRQTETSSNMKAIFERPLTIINCREPPRSAQDRDSAPVLFKDV